MLLDDILWVLTDSQMKAVILHIRSLMPVIEKAANLSKARAADKGQVEMYIGSFRNLDFQFWFWLHLSTIVSPPPV